MLANLKAALAARRMHQVDLALSLGIAPSLLSEVVTGRRAAEPSLRSRIAAALRADESWLFARIVEIPAPGSCAEVAPVGARGS